MTSHAMSSSVHKKHRAEKQRERSRSVRSTRSSRSSRPGGHTNISPADVPPTRLIFVRHGETELNRTGNLRGLADVPLNESGRAQAHAVARRLAGVELAAIYSSPLARAMQTAEAIVARRSLAVIPDARLRDIDYGAWESRTPDDIERNRPGSFHRWRTDPESVLIPRGERLSAVRGRLHALIRDIVARHPGDTVVVVGHDVIGRVLLAQFLGMPLRRLWRIAQDNGAVDVVDGRAGEVVVRAVNDTARLRGTTGDQSDCTAPRGVA